MVLLEQESADVKGQEYPDHFAKECNYRLHWTVSRVKVKGVYGLQNV